MLLLLALQLMLQSSCVLLPTIAQQTESPAATTVSSSPSADAPGQANTWDHKHTWVFSVGVLESLHKDMAGFTKTHRRDASIIQAFRAKGVPENHILFLKDNDATLSLIRSRLVKLLEQTQPGDTLFFYYCGHGWVDGKVGYFGNYDAGDDAESCLSTDVLVSDLSGFKGKTAIFTVDCYHSGSLIDSLKKANPPFDYGVLTAAEAAQSPTGNWTFSQAVLDCLQGHIYADANKDGTTTFAELGQYIKTEMKDLEQHDSGIATSLKFDPSFRIARTTFAQEAIPQRVEAFWEKNWYPAKLLETIGDQGKIHWLSIGWDGPDDDEWVDLSRVRKVGSKTTIGAETASSGDTSSAPDVVAEGEPALSVGSRVQVLYKNDYRPAQIIKSENGKYFIHFDGHDDTSDEWVAIDRIKRR